jgi:RNA polymerase sigma factor (sigma-70 family)
VTETHVQRTSVAQIRIRTYVRLPTETIVSLVPVFSCAIEALMAERALYQLPHLLEQVEPAARDEAWTEFVDANSKLILYVARSLGGEHDDVMDRYAFVLGQLRRDDFHRLRAYGADGRGKFTTWLVVVVRRLCLDHRREKYGRLRDTHEDQADGQRMRGRLVDLISEETELMQLVDTSGAGPEEQMRTLERDGALKSAIAALEPDDRLLLRLRFEDELPVAKIARIMSCRSQFDVYRRLRRVLDSLRTVLIRNGVGDPAP